MPVWQEFYQKYVGFALEVLSVAIDCQGVDLVRPFVEAAQTTFVTLIDQENLLSTAFGFKAVPNCLLVDESGLLVYKQFGGFDIRKSESARLLKGWVITGQLPGETYGPEIMQVDSNHRRSSLRFSEGLELYKDGRIEDARGKWREAVAMEPDNYVVRKQIWAIENPDKFYSGEVDYEWQRSQIEKGL